MRFRKLSSRSVRAATHRGVHAVVDPLVRLVVGHGKPMLKAPLKAACRFRRSSPSICAPASSAALRTGVPRQRPRVERLFAVERFDSFPGGVRFRYRARPPRSRRTATSTPGCPRGTMPTRKLSTSLRFRNQVPSTVIPSLPARNISKADNARICRPRHGPSVQHGVEPPVKPRAPGFR